MGNTHIQWTTVIEAVDIETGEQLNLENGRAGTIKETYDIKKVTTTTKVHEQNNYHYGIKTIKWHCQLKKPTKQFKLF